MSKGVLKVFLTIFSIFLLTPNQSSLGQNDKDKNLIFVGMPKGVNSYSSKQDFNNAMSYWVDNLLKVSNEKTELKASIKSIDINLLSEQFIEEHNLYFVNLCSADYFRLRHKIQLTPYLSTVKPEGINYLIVANNKFNSVQELKNAKAIFISSQNFMFSHTWLEYILQSANNSSSKDLSPESNHVNNESEAINSIFFGKGDFCIITEEAYDTAVELNPQIRNRTKVLVQSKGVIPTLFCLTKKIDKKTKEILYNSVKNLTKSESGKQILKMFKISRICFMNDIKSALKNTESIINNVIRLKKSK